MVRKSSTLGFLTVLSVACALIMLGCDATTTPTPTPTATPTPSSEFATLRAAVKTYLSQEGAPITSAASVEAIVEDSTQAALTDIVSVRANDVYQIGHVPGAINIPWRTIADDASLAMLDKNTPTIAYCYTGHTGQVSTTILGMLGYDVDNMKYGMMGWTDDPDILGTTPFNCEPPNYDTETTVNTLPAVQDTPTINTGETDAEAIAKAQAQEMLVDWAPTINASDVYAIIGDATQAANYVIVSVRGADDYAKGHVSGAINIPWTTLADDGMLEMLPTDKKIITYCYTGHTGQIAATLLRLLGYDSVNMKFGMMGWTDDATVLATTPFDCNPPNYDTVAGPNPYADSGADGATLFSDNCAACHGADGTGGIGPDITGYTAAELDTGLSSATHSSISLTAEEVDAIATFLGG